MTQWSDLSAIDRDILVAVGLAERPTGVAIKQYLADEKGWQTVSSDHVYPALSRLESRDLISIRTDPRNAKCHLHSLTRAGAGLLAQRRDELDDAADHAVEHERIETDGGTHEDPTEGSTDV